MPEAACVPTVSTVGGLPARLASWKLAAALLPATVAVAVNVPAVAFASNRGEVATPAALVVSVACALPPRKLAPALPAPEAPPAPPPLEPSVKVTLSP